MTWRLLLERHLEHLLAQGYARRTLKLSRHWLERFLDFCLAHQLAKPSGLTPEDLGAYRRHLVGRPGRNGRPYSANTVAVALGRVRVFLTWATEHGYLLLDPTRGMRVRRPDATLRKVLSPEEVELLLSLPSAASPTGLRDRAILESFYGTGIRRAECQGLDLIDLDLGEGTLWVRRAKGGRERLLPVGQALARSLERYLAEVRPVLARRAGEPALFLDSTGSRLSLGMLSRMVWLYGHKAGLGTLSPHALRHAFALHMAEGGADLGAIQVLLGHAHPETTQLYLRLRPLELHQMHRRSHPRARRQDDPSSL